MGQTPYPPQFAQQGQQVYGQAPGQQQQQQQPPMMQPAQYAQPQPQAGQQAPQQYLQAQQSYPSSALQPQPQQQQQLNPAAQPASGVSQTHPPDASMYEYAPPVSAPAQAYLVPASNVHLQPEQQLQPFPYQSGQSPSQTQLSGVQPMLQQPSVQLTYGYISLHSFTGHAMRMRCDSRAYCTYFVQQHDTLLQLASQLFSYLLDHL